MNINYYLIFLLLITLNSCSISDGELLVEIEQASTIEITKTFHGSIAGSGQIEYTLKKSRDYEAIEEWILIRDEGSQFRTYIPLDSAQLNTFRQFVKEAINSHDSKRVYTNSCMSQDPCEYDIHVSGYSRHLQPDEKTDSLFYSLTKEFCFGKQMFD